MGPEWDEAKNHETFAQHEIWSEDAIRVFYGLVVSRIDHRFACGKIRLKTCGIIEEPGVVTIVQTDCNGRKSPC